MNKQTQKGWLMALSKKHSQWGSVEEFFDSIDPSKTGNVINVESKVWGKFDKKDVRPSRGDGWAFYHTRKARFEHPDPYGRLSRITLIGELMDFQKEGEDFRVSVKISRANMEKMRSGPIIWSDTTKHLGACLEHDGKKTEVFED